MSAESVVVAVGDILVLRDVPGSMFAHTRDQLRSADIAFGQLETAYSDKGSQGSSGPRGAVPKDPKNRPAIADAGFDVLSVASNHTYDWGADALLDCIDNLRKDGVLPIGAGKNIAEARKPAILERNGLRIAFLAYCSVAPEGYYAASEKPGCAPMRAITHYEPFEPDQPGTPARTMTFPVAADLEALEADIREAKENADFVAVSMHWGIHEVRAVLADYQQVVAHAAIGAGADILFGHHPHVLKGIEVYKGKVIFYSLGNFAMDTFAMGTPALSGRVTSNIDWLAEARQVYGAAEPVSDGSKSGFFRGLRQTMIAKWTISERGTERVSFVPCSINESSEPVPLDPSSHEGADVVHFITDITSEAQLNAEYTVDEREVVIGHHDLETVRDR